MEKSLKKLEIERLIKELEFLESDYNYQSSVVSTKEYEFMNSIQTIVQEHPDLKKISDSRTDILSKPIDTDEVVEEDWEDSEFRGKRLYREIVKMTHPDKIKSPKLNELYIMATEAYEFRDMVELYKISNNLGIEIELDDLDIEEIISRIRSMRSKIESLKSSWTYKWILSKNKNEVIVQYIKDNYLNLISR